MNSKLKILLMFILLLLVVYILGSQSKSSRISLFAYYRLKPSKVLIVFSHTPNKNRNPFSTKMFQESFHNKQQYAQLKGYDLFYSDRQLDLRLNTYYNKISVLQHILANKTIQSVYEWIFWIDIDALIFDMSLDIPFHKYSNYNFILWGDTKQMYEVGDHNSLNSGVFLLRNNEWSREFLDTIATYGYKDGKARANELSKLVNYTQDKSDQAAIVYILRYNYTLMQNVFFERELGINRYWREHFSTNLGNSIIIHFCGCGFFSPYGYNKNCIPVWDIYVNRANRSFQKELNIQKGF